MKSVESLREQCLIMARLNNTPVSFWLSCTLSELGRWIVAHNRIQAAFKKE